MTLMPKRFSHVFQFTRFVHCIVGFHFHSGAQFAEQGDIKSEFDSEQEKVREEDKRRREAEERLGSELAERLEAEEKERQRVAEEQESSDRQYASNMWREMTRTPASGRKRKTSVIELLKKSADKKTKIQDEETKTKEAESNSSHSPDLDDRDLTINFSDERLLNEQKLIESKLAQEKKDEELARKLSRDMMNTEIKTPSSSKTPNSKVKSSGRQLKLFECSSKPVKVAVAEDCPSASKRMGSPSDKENNSKILNGQSESDILDIFKKKLEDDLSSVVNLRAGPECSNQEMKEISDQEALDAQLALKLQQEMDEEVNGSCSHKSGEDDSRVVRNVFDVLSQSQKTQSSSKAPHRHKSVPCKTCANCVRENCGRCSSCRDMPQFGGRGLCRQSCVLRKCLKPTKGKCASC